MELERDVEQYLVRSVRSAGGRCEKFIPDYRAGWPDRIVLLPGGVSAWVELKRPRGGRLSPQQRHAHKVLRGLGQRVAVVWTKEDVDRLIAELFAAART